MVSLPFQVKTLIKCNITGTMDITKNIIVNEANSIKTCSKCGDLNWGIGGKKIFKCRESECGMVTNRDANAAKNIFSKNASVGDLSSGCCSQAALGMLQSRSRGTTGGAANREAHSIPLLTDC